MNRFRTQLLASITPALDLTIGSRWNRSPTFRIAPVPPGRLRLRLLCWILLAVFGFSAESQASLFRWDTGEAIPNTDDLTIRRGVTISGKELQYADLASAELPEAQLQDVNLSRARLLSADLAGSRINDSAFTEADFGNANLSHVVFRGGDLTGSSFRNANLKHARFFNGIHLREADFTNAEVQGAFLPGPTFFSEGLQEQQLYATSSYRNGSLRGVQLESNDLTGWNFSGQDLAGASFARSRLDQADFSGALIQAADFSQVTDGGISFEQLESTASFQSQDLRSVSLSGNMLRGVDFSHQDLSAASITDADLRDAQFREANLASATLFSSTFLRANLENASLVGARLAGAHFPSANLAGAKLAGTTIRGNIINTDLRGADLRNADLSDARINRAIVDETTVYNRWTLFPEEFDPAAAGLTLSELAPGDFDGDGRLGVGDVDLLMHKLRLARSHIAYLDLNDDRFLTNADLESWIHDLKGTSFGDANLDGVFDSRDLVQVLAAGTFESAIDLPATWSTGDWNSDGHFTSADLVVALQDGGYQTGEQFAAAVPEASSEVLAYFAILLLTLGKSCSRHRRCRQRSKADTPYCRHHVSYAPSVVSARHAKTRIALTLVELLVAIAIVGALVSLLLPALTAARSRARRTFCMSQLRRIGSAIHVYETRTRRYPGMTNPNRELRIPVSWFNELMPELEEGTTYERIMKIREAPPIATCPDDRAPRSQYAPKLYPWMSYAINAGRFNEPAIGGYYRTSAYVPEPPDHRANGVAHEIVFKHNNRIFWRRELIVNSKYVS